MAPRKSYQQQRSTAFSSQVSGQQKTAPPIASVLGRPTCYCCFRPKSHCICIVTDQIQAHVKVLILQHPNEFKKYYGTAKIVTQVLTNSRIIRGLEGLSQQEILGGVSGTNYILFPRADAQDASAVRLNDNDQVITIDGTWSEAGKLISRNPWLQKLPAISFNAKLDSRYRIRKQPKMGYLSTIESLYYLLTQNAQAFAGEVSARKYEKLIAAFDAMVEKQLKFIPQVRR